MMQLSSGIEAVDIHLPPLSQVVRASFLEGLGGIQSRGKISGNRLHLCESRLLGTWGKGERNLR